MSDAYTAAAAGLFPNQAPLGNKIGEVAVLMDKTGRMCMAVTPLEERFREAILPHLDSAFNLACWLTRNRDDAQDVVQDAMLRAFRFFGGFHGADGRVWLLRIVRNSFYSWLQENAARTATAFDEELHSFADDHGDANPEALLGRKEDARLVQQALAALPLEFREVVVMRELEELSYKEIAAIAGIPIGTVMSRLGRGRKLLAQSLGGGK
jgi:RNA polymerase sigma factor (sigma-70 family)